MGPPIRKIFLKIHPRLEPAELERLLVRFRTVYDQETCLDARLFPAVHEVLGQLRDEERNLFVATNKPRLPTLRIVEHFGIASFFKEIVSPDAREPIFPDKAAMVRAVLETHQLDPAATLLVGDALDDSVAAGACGIGFVAARYGYGEVRAGSFPHGRFDIDSPGALPGALQAFAAAVSTR